MLSQKKQAQRILYPAFILTVVALLIFIAWPQSQCTEKLGIKFIDVPKGSFKMGDGEGWARPVHTVILSDFKISKYEITNAQYVAFLNDRGNQMEGGKPWIAVKGPFDKIEQKDENTFIVQEGFENHPVIWVSWYGARAFCKWIGARLPTEAEWEYTARAGGKDIKYPWGNEFDGTKVNFADKNSSARHRAFRWDDGYAETAPVGNYPPNELGVYDMAGNVSEWCQDWYGEYRTGTFVDPKGYLKGKERICRGGSWYGVPVRSASRDWYSPNFWSNDIGFRCACDNN